jgi:hypothetical protein
MLDRFTNRFATSAFFMLVVLSSSLGAQSLPAAPPPDTSSDESPVTNLDEKPLKVPSKDDYFSKGFARQLMGLWPVPYESMGSSRRVA